MLVSSSVLICECADAWYSEEVAGEVGVVEGADARYDARSFCPA
jgi:hypothetical protein